MRAETKKKLRRGAVLLSDLSPLILFLLAILFCSLPFFRLYNDEGQLIIRGVHALGSGDAHANKYYTLPQPTAPLATRQDTIDYQIPLVEDMIITEMALEGAFEGYRFYAPMRGARRRSDPAYLATPVSRRKNSEGDPQLYQLLMDTRNWYLPLR
jgi:hypothetical protein